MTYKDILKNRSQIILINSTKQPLMGIKSLVFTTIFNNKRIKVNGSLRYTTHNDILDIPTKETSMNTN